MNKALLSTLLPGFVAKTTNDGGLTYDFKSRSYVEPQNYWYFPKYPGLTKIVGIEGLSDSLADFLKFNYAHLLEADTVFGTWINPRTKKVYLDINTFIDDKRTALSKAKEYSRKDGREIVSMYNPIQNATEYIEH